MELGSHRELDYASGFNSCFSDNHSVFATLLRTAAETAISEVHKLFCTGGVPRLLNTVVLAMTDGLFRLCGLECFDELFISTPHPHPPPPSPFPISLMV